MGDDRRIEIGLRATRWCSRATAMLRPAEDFKNREVVIGGKVVPHDSAHEWAVANGWVPISATYETVQPTVWALMARDGDTVTIAFRGTSSVSDWTTYNSPMWDAVPQVLEFFRGTHWLGTTHEMPDIPAQLASGPSGYEAPAGFLTLLFVLRANLLNTFASMLAVDPSAVRKVQIFGHSLGCTVAQFLYVDLVDAFERGAHKTKARPQFTVGLLASPRCFAQRSAPAVGTDDTVVRFEVLTDPVPLLPKRGVRRQMFRWEVGYAAGGRDAQDSTEELTALGELVRIWGAGDARTLGTIAEGMRLATSFVPYAGTVSNAGFRWARRIWSHFIEVYAQSLQSSALQPDQVLGVLSSAEVKIVTADKPGAGTDNGVLIDFGGFSRLIEQPDPRHRFQRNQKITIDLQVGSQWSVERLRETALIVVLQKGASIGRQWLPKRFELTLALDDGQHLKFAWEFDDLWIEPLTGDDSNRIMRSAWPLAWQRPLLVDNARFTLRQFILPPPATRRRYFDVLGNPDTASNNTSVIAFETSDADAAQRNRRFHAVYDEPNAAYRLYAHDIKTPGGAALSVHVKNKALDGTLVLHEPDPGGSSLEFWCFLPLGHNGYHIVLKQRPDLCITDDGDRLKLAALRYGGQHQTWELAYV